MKALAHLEARRVRTYGDGRDGDAFNGAFKLTAAPTRATLYVIASDGGDWDHVSASVKGEKRCPTWAEMAWLKDQFFHPSEAVMQLHPPLSDYVNNHPFCLHLWRPQWCDVPLPPSLMVGFTELTPAMLKHLTPAELEALRGRAAAHLLGQSA